MTGVSERSPLVPSIPDFSEASPVAGDGGESGGGGRAGRKANSLMQSLEGVLGDAGVDAGLFRCFMLLLVVPVILFAAWSVWTLSATGAVGGEGSPCAGAAWWAPGNPWVWLLSAVVVLLLDPIASSLAAVLYMNCEDKDKAAAESIQLGYRVTAFIVNLALTLWGVLLWASLSPACEALCAAGDEWWLLAEFRVYVLFVALKSLVLGFFAVQLALGGEGGGGKSERAE